MILNQPDYQAAINYLSDFLLCLDLPALIHFELKRQYAALEAQKQMTSFLDDYFGQNRNVLVINNFSFEQCKINIDHLILTKSDVICVDSKSIVEKFHVDVFGSWTRTFKHKDEPIKSPINILKNHIRVLQEFIEYSEQEFNLLSKLKSHTFKGFLATSNETELTGDIEKFKDIIFKNKYLADKILKASKNGRIEDVPKPTITNDELYRVGQFLIKNNSPISSLHSVIELTKRLANEHYFNQEAIRTINHEKRVCLRCGSDMLLRVRKEDPSSYEFWSCYRFPRCKFTINPSSLIDLS